MNTILYVGKHAPTWTVSRHVHQSWELIFCTGGSGEMLFDDKTLSYGVNDVAIVPPMIPHANASREGFTNIHMNLTDPALTYTEPFIIRADSNGFLRDAFAAAFYYWSESSAGYALLPLYGQLIVAHLTQYRSSRRHSETVQQIEDNILQHYPECAYDLNAYLSSLPFNTEYLKKMFKRETGLTPLQYLTNRRLENASPLRCPRSGVRGTSRRPPACADSATRCTSRGCLKRSTAFLPAIMPRSLRIQPRPGRIR